MKRSYQSSALKSQYSLVDRVRVIELVQLVVAQIQVYAWDESELDVKAAEKLLEWESSESGQWVKSHAVGDIEWRLGPPGPARISWPAVVIATLNAQDATFWKLKWADSLQR